MNNVHSRFQVAYENAHTTEVVSLPVLCGEREALFVYRARRLPDGGLIDSISHVYVRNIHSNAPEETTMDGLVGKDILKQALSTPFASKIVGIEAANLIHRYHEAYDAALKQPTPVFPQACKTIIDNLFTGGLFLLYEALLNC